jgi:hypothetical protein
MSTRVQWIVRVWFPQWDAYDEPDQDGLMTLTEAEAREVIIGLDRLQADDLIGQYTVEQVEDLPAAVTVEGLKRMLVSDDDAETWADFNDCWNGVPPKIAN